VATDVQTGSTVAIISKLSTVPKVHLVSSRSETLTPPPLIYRALNRIHSTTSVAKQSPCWWSIGQVATGLQFGSTVGIFSMLSRVPKLHVERCSSETLRPPPLMYWAPSRIHPATSVAKQTPCWWSTWTGGYGPPNWLYRWNISYVIKRTKAACRQVQLGNAETSTTYLLGSKQNPRSHLCGKADTLLVELLDRWLRASELDLTLEYFLRYKAYQSCM